MKNYFGVKIVHFFAFFTLPQQFTRTSKVVNCKVLKLLTSKLKENKYELWMPKFEKHHSKVQSCQLHSSIETLDIQILKKVSELLRFDTVILVAMFHHSKNLWTLKSQARFGRTDGRWTDVWTIRDDDDVMLYTAFSGHVNLSETA